MSDSEIRTARKEELEDSVQRINLDILFKLDSGEEALEDLLAIRETIQAELAWREFISIPHWSTKVPIVMSHHMNDMPSELLNRLRRELGTPPGLGATGEYPRGKLNDDDQGEIRIAIAADMSRRLVVMDFGTPAKWIGFTPEEASNIADLLMEKVNKLRGIS
jgi:hypothetical protein